MKNTFLLLLLVLTALTSCNRIPLFTEENTYDKFSQEDYKFIPQKYKQQNDVHNFISNSGQTITLKNNGYNLTEEVVYPSMTQIVHYDNLLINLNWTTLTECNYIEIKISKSSDNRIFYNLVFWTKDNGCNGIQKSFNSSETFSKMQVGGITYNYVTIIDLNNFFINASSSKKINKIYYDLEKGFIGFENAQTNEQYWTS